MSGVISAAAVALAVLIVALIVTPVHVWKQPATDATYRGFDSNLLFVSPTGPATNSGIVKVTPDALTIGALAQSHPTVDLLTTPLSFFSSFDVEVVAQAAQSVPLRIEVWSPENAAGYFLVFDHDAGDVIRAETVDAGSGQQDLVGGVVTNNRVLGHYVLGQPYHVTMNVDQSGRRIDAQISGPGLPDAGSTITAADAPDLFKAFRYSLTVSSSAVAEPTQAVIRNFAVTLPSQSNSSAEAAVTIDDPIAHTLVEVLLAAAIVICLLAVALRLASPQALGRARARLLWMAAELRVRWRLVGGLALVCVIYVVANVPLFVVATPHYDVLSAKIWAYVADNYGFADLYYRTLIVSAAGAWSGIPLHEAGFPYGVTKAYYYLAAGWTYHHLWPGQSVAENINGFSLEALLKGLNVLFGFADGILTYLILKRLVSKPTALTSALLLALNPAVVFVMSVWGSTETVSLFFVLSSIWLAELDMPLGAWLMLLGAAYTRPQMFVLAFLLGAMYLRKFGALRNLRSLSWTVIVFFIFLAPFALTISPSLPFDWVARTLTYHFGNGQADVPYLGTSPGYYSIWTLPLLLVNGQHGLDRMWSPSTQHLLGSLTYGQVGAALSVSFLLVVGATLLLVRRLSAQPGQYLPVVAFGMLGWLMFTPGLISRYFVYAVVGIILCRQVFSTTGYVYALAVLTTITLVTSFGHISQDFLGYSGSASVVSSTNNEISRLVVALFSADWFITFGTLANIALLVVLGMKSWEAIRSSRRPEPQPV
ncbi:MAG: hypothetical protein ACHQ0J_08190 [Candidatus Dormibacterales bacterium]